MKTSGGRVLPVVTALLLVGACGGSGDAARPGQADASLDTLIGINISSVKDWSEDRLYDRSLPSWASFNRNPGGIYGWEGIGVPLEHVIRLSNEMATDPWINIPARATDDYVRKTALMPAYGSDGINPYSGPQANPVYPPLNPDRKIYVEYSNEVWNPNVSGVCG